jgi:hypothetical protein
MALMNLSSLAQQRDQVLEHMRALDRMRRGSFSRQFLKARGKGDAARGPYYVLQGYFKGEKFSERVPAEKASRVEEEVANYRRFQELCERFVTITDQMTRMTDEEPGSKKNSRKKRSPRNSSAKRRPS